MLLALISLSDNNNDITQIQENLTMLTKYNTPFSLAAGGLSQEALSTMELLDTTY